MVEVHGAQGEPDPLRFLAGALLSGLLSSDSLSVTVSC